MSKPTGDGRSQSKRSRPRTADPSSSKGVHRAPLRAARGIRIGILGFDSVTALDLVGPADAFSTANEVWQALQGGPLPYRITLLGLNRRSFVAESGLSFEAHALLDDAPALDTLIVPGGRGLRETKANAHLVGWLRAHARALRRANADLRASEERSRAITEAANDAIISADSGGGADKGADHRGAAPR